MHITKHINRVLHSVSWKKGFGKDKWGDSMLFEPTGEEDIFETKT